VRWNRWVRLGIAILAPALFGVMLAAGEWAREPASFASGGEDIASPAGTSETGQTPEPVRDVQRALAQTGYHPGSIDGIFGPRTEAALRRYIAARPPRVPTAADLVIARFRAGERRDNP